MRIYVWKSTVRMLAAEASNGLAAKLAARTKSRGIIKLQDTMARIMRGELGRDSNPNPHPDTKPDHDIGI